jgi:hypothetical protein
MAWLLLQEDCMSKRTFPTLLVCVVIGTLCTLRAADDPFVGKWKLNPAKSKYTDRMKVESAGGNKYGFSFGAAPEPEMIVLDGTDQPGVGGTTLAVSAEGPKTWKVVRKKDGKTMIIGIWTLSDDGNTLTDKFTSTKPDGSMSTITADYKRTTPGSGFVGSWESPMDQMMSGFELQIEPYAGNGLSFVYPSRTRNMKFDGKDYPDTGKNALAGSVGSGRRVNERTLELTDKLNGRVTNTQQITLSADAKVLTFTASSPGQMKPNVFVFDRQ